MQGRYVVAVTVRLGLGAARAARNLGQRVFGWNQPAPTNLGVFLISRGSGWYPGSGRLVIASDR